MVDTLPAGTTFVTASPGCSGTGPVDCALGLIAVAQSVTVKIVVTSPATVPVGGTITNSGSASPGDQFGATETTTVKTPDPDVSIGFVLPGASIGTTGDQPAAVTLPRRGVCEPTGWPPPPKLAVQ